VNACWLLADRLLRARSDTYSSQLWLQSAGQDTLLVLHGRCLNVPLGTGALLPTLLSDHRACQICLETECEWRKLPRPPYLRRWCNLKQVFSRRYRRTGNLRKSVESLGKAQRHGRCALSAAA
jgi:hypothetical protein